MQTIVDELSDPKSPLLFVFREAGNRDCWMSEKGCESTIVDCRYCLGAGIVVVG